MRRAEAGIQVDKFYPPTDWLDNNSKQIDIRKNAENNSIVLLVGHSADFTKYSLLGLLAQVSSGTYDVYIDDVLVGSGITKNTQYDIDFSTINTSYGSATTPEALVLHKVVIKPTTSGEKITALRCARTAGASGEQSQGVLWCHFNLINTIDINYLFRQNNYYTNNILVACSAKNNIINFFSTGSNCISSFALCYILEYIPNIYFDKSKNFYVADLLNQCRKLKQVNLKGTLIGGNIFYSDDKLEKIKDNVVLKVSSGLFYRTHKLKQLPNINFDNATDLTFFLTEAKNLYPTKITVTGNTTTKLDMYSTSTYPMRGLRGLKVSNEAPFTGSSPQINVSYTGLDRDALVELFQSLPTVSNNQILKCDHCTGTANLTDEDKAIATNKGWGLTLS